MDKNLNKRNVNGGLSGTGAVIAFDTSNYTTSVAVVDLKGNVISDRRKLLDVKTGERGLRQSEALFQHIVNLPELTREAMRDAENLEILAVASSNRPRPVDGSYMPVFRGGVLSASEIAAVMRIPSLHFSHQEGHIAAVRELRNPGEMSLTFHMSGGTGEILLTDGNTPVEIVGGTRDLSFGQLIDRTGVAAGYAFPAGACLDRIAVEASRHFKVKMSRTGKSIMETNRLKNIHIDGSYADISGIETQISRIIKESGADEELVLELFCRISDALFFMITDAMKKTGTRDIVMAGGVSASAFLRDNLTARFADTPYDISFGAPELSTDNAVGVAKLAAAEILAEK